MYAGTSGGQGGSGREQSCECSGQANDRMSLPFSSALCFYVGVYVFMYDGGAYCQIHLFFAAFICMNINEVTGVYVCMYAVACTRGGESGFGMFLCFNNAL